MVFPPSTTSSAPVVFLAFAEKYQTASATSSPAATSPIGVNFEGTFL